MKFKKLFIILAAAGVMTACGTDNDVDSSIVVFDSTAPARNNFDNWLQENYTKPYNIKFLYRYNDKETDKTYNVIPADLNKAKALAIMIKHVWLDAYAEAAGPDFIKTYSPRIYQLIGSAEYSSGGSNEMVLGTAEGGLKVTVFRVNAITPENPWIDQDNPYPYTSQSDPMDLNYWFFHTMHHEFCHILTQTKNYSTEFQSISTADYQNTNWVNVDDWDAPAKGFTSGYGSKEYNEDFAEIFSFYVTHTQAAFEKLLDDAIVETDVVLTDNNGNPVYKTDNNGNLIPKTDEEGNPVYKTDVEGNVVYKKVTDEEGNETYEPVIEYEQEMEKDYTYYDKLVAKFNIVYDYFKNSWGIDLDELREIVLRRSKEVEKGVDITDGVMSLKK
jgi:substrate import-associated zinc metallohydrolase lipoprotein